MEATEEEKSLIIFKQEFHSVVNEVDTKNLLRVGISLSLIISCVLSATECTDSSKIIMVILFLEMRLCHSL